MNAIQNRNAVYHEFKDTALSQMKALVYNVIKEIQPCTTKDVVDYLNKGLDPVKDKKKIMSINKVSGRITELNRLFLVAEYSRVKDKSTNCYNTEYCTLSVDEALIKQRIIDLNIKLDDLKRDLKLNPSLTTILLIEAESKKTAKEIASLKKIIQTPLK